MKNAHGYGLIEDFEMKRQQKRLFLEQMEIKKRQRK